ncbi:SIR2 family protein [Owenweeksia hongkongensis]|uniref:SIR2 family protein n=1 Tax=Owenweeksia hongkongensis TaxID=253245 RepID=UPI003A95BD70
MRQEHETFVKDFVESLQDRSAAIFAGAGLSVGAGFVDWKGLLEDIAKEIGLDIQKEDDLLAVAQYHYNENRGRGKLNKKILNIFTEAVDETENHKVLARLPVSTYWTTNYDNLIEAALERNNMIVDVKHQKEQLPSSKFKRDVVVYKMHGDAAHPADAIITRDDYEKYFRTHEPFINALQGDLITKTFLFIGFSFNDPNLEYALSRVRLNFGDNSSHHYCFIKNVDKTDFFDKNGDFQQADFEYHKRKQELRINDLREYHIIPIMVDSYGEITEILKEIERRFRMKSIFISGSAEEYGDWGKERAVKLIHRLSGKLIAKQYRIVNGFGWGVGSAVINGALEEIYKRPQRHSEDQLVLKPFPQFATGEKMLDELWQEYRERMISLTGIAIFLFGNKKDLKGGEKVILADGVRKEFEIALASGCLPIPIGSTGYMSKKLWEEVYTMMDQLFDKPENVRDDFETISNEQNADKIIMALMRIIEQINNN